MTAAAEAHRAAKDADDAFEAAVLAAGFKSRWDADAMDVPAVKAARDAKVAADRAWNAAFAAAFNITA